MNHLSGPAEEDFVFTIKAEGEDTAETVVLRHSDLIPMDRDQSFRRAVASFAPAVDNWAPIYREAAKSRAEYAANIKSNGYIKSLAAYGDRGNLNLFPFRNSGGVLNGGVCWWHSRFQRAALYLTYYLPSEPRPTDGQANSIIRSLMRADRVQPIPGFNNFAEFSLEYQEIIQRRLEQTQVMEGLFLFAWMNGLAGRSQVSAASMKAKMDAIYEEVSVNGLAYVKLQTPGIDCHSWIITEMIPGQDDGYYYSFVDSNFPSTPLKYQYNKGEAFIEMIGVQKCVPYLQRTRELADIKEIISTYIRGE